MRSAALDRRVRKEARLLVREARRASGRPRVGDAPRGAAAGEDTPEAREAAAEEAAALQAAALEVEEALAGDDLARVRRGLPALDERVDELPRYRKSLLAEYAWAIGSLLALVFSVRAFVVEAFKIPSSSMFPTLEINDHLFVNKFIYGLRDPFTGGKWFERSPRRGEVIVFIYPCEPERDYIKRVIALAGDTVEVRCNVVYVNGAAVPSELIQGDGCEHLDNQSGEWLPVRCSRYRETLGGITYETYHDVDRPRRDRELVAAGGLAYSDLKDFPPEMLSTCASAALSDARAAQNQRPGTIVKTQDAVGRLGACRQQRHYVVPDGHVFVMGDHRNGSNDSRWWGSVPIENVKGKALFIWLSYQDSLFDGSGIRWSRMGSFVD